MKKKQKYDFTVGIVAISALHIGLGVSIMTVVLVGGGAWLDNYWQTSPVLIILGGVLSLIASGFLVYQIIKPLLTLANKKK